MKISIIAASVAAVMQMASVSADLHNFCACAKRFGGNAVQGAYWNFKTPGTEEACRRYRLRNTGNKPWDQCKDCRMDVQSMDAQRDIPSCFSPGYHMGGDEFDYYCGLQGLQGYCRNQGAKQGRFAIPSTEEEKRDDRPV